MTDTTQIDATGAETPEQEAETFKIKRLQDEMKARGLMHGDDPSSGDLDPATRAALQRAAVEGQLDGPNKMSPELLSEISRRQLTGRAVIYDFLSKMSGDRFIETTSYRHSQLTDALRAAPVVANASAGVDGWHPDSDADHKKGSQLQGGDWWKWAVTGALPADADELHHPVNGFEPTVDTDSTGFGVGSPDKPAGKPSRHASDHQVGGASVRTTGGTSATTVHHPVVHQTPIRHSTGGTTPAVPHHDSVHPSARSVEDHPDYDRDSMSRAMGDEGDSRIPQNMRALGLYAASKYGNAQAMTWLNNANGDPRNMADEVNRQVMADGRKNGLSPGAIEKQMYLVYSLANESYGAGLVHGTQHHNSTTTGSPAPGTFSPTGDDLAFATRFNTLNQNNEFQLVNKDGIRKSAREFSVEDASRIRREGGVLQFTGEPRNDASKPESAFRENLEAFAKANGMHVVGPSDQDDDRKYKLLPGAITPSAVPLPPSTNRSSYNDLKSQPVQPAIPSYAMVDTQRNTVPAGAGTPAPVTVPPQTVIVNNYNNYNYGARGYNRDVFRESVIYREPVDVIPLVVIGGSRFGVNWIDGRESWEYQRHHRYDHGGGCVSRGYGGGDHEGGHHGGGLRRTMFMSP